MTTALTPAPDAAPEVSARELARPHTQLAVDALVEIVRDASITDAAGRAAVIAASRTLLEYAWGKPEQSIGGIPGQPIEARLVVVMPDNGRGKPALLPKGPKAK